jgi:hypothetical protein
MTNAFDSEVLDRDLGGAQAPEFQPGSSQEIAMSPFARRPDRLGWTLAIGLATVISMGPMPLLAQDVPGNVFISPCGRPFRAKPDAPYPVVDWFKQADTNGDGKLDHAEFVADTLAFFKVLDRNGDGVISPQEISIYEQRIAPEVLGMRVLVDGTTAPDRLLWLTQGVPGGSVPGGSGTFRPGEATGPIGRDDPDAGADTGPDGPGPSRPYDASGAGASPYSFFDEPEPVAAADVHCRGLIHKEDFLRLAEVHFETLDSQHRGYLTLDTLPETPVQRKLQRNRHRGR